VFAVLACAAAGPAAGRDAEERIVFQSTRHGGANEIYTMRPDATDIRRLTWNDATERLPRFSRDGTRIVFTRNADVWVMDADGTDELQLTSGPVFDEAPVFTRGGEHVVFERHAGPGTACPCGLWIVDVDGGEARALDFGPGDELNPDVGESGKLAFASNRGGSWGIFVARLHGGLGQRVTTGPAAFGDFRPRWAPRGNRLVFMRDDGTSNNDIWVVRADGTGLAQVTSGERFEEQAGWTPDGERIVFAVFEVGGPAARLLTIRPDGTDQRLIPQLAAPFSDGFGDDRIDTSLWHTIVTGTHTAIAETGGEVVATIGAASEPGGPFNGIDAHLGSQCSLPGDYDMQVSYRLLEWPAANGIQVALNAYFAGAFVFRESKPWGEQVGGWVPPVFGASPATDLAGTLRLVRTGGVVTASVLRAGVWTPLASGPNPGSAVFGFSASSFADWSHQDVRVAFDDFSLHSGALACPSWWRDAGPDWSVVR
jgi:Tol biopolymer transport system component